VTERRGPTIRASEVGQYVFCSTSWWLARVQGIEPNHQERLDAGREAHAAHDRERRAAELAQRLGYALLTLAVIVGAILVATFWGAS
jgi:CRISPR/Cas system-associated exonuclease Cas4 (RecB family)